MSAVVVTPGTFASLRRTVEALARQTVADRIELVVVAPTREAVAEAEALGAFHSVTIVPQGEIANVDHAAAAGLIAGRGLVVSSIEDHAFPDPEWAERVLDAWDGPYDAIGTTVDNANPDSKLSWTNILIAYAAWAPGTPDGEIEAVPAHNVSYRREALTPYSNHLPSLMGREGHLFREMKERGAKFRFVSGARVTHLNPSSLKATAALRFDAGRLYGARRAADGRWPIWKRAAYAGLSPLIPAIRYRRLRQELFGPARPNVTERRFGPALLLGLAFDAAGQAAGYLAGAGGSAERLETFEMDRIQHLNPKDRARFAPVQAPAASV
nr:glycosyltransferase [Parvularcula dongshanensis]